MTPKKDIVRKPVYAMPDGTNLTAYRLGEGFTPKETAFIVWYTYPGTEAFLNAGRAAVRAGYKPDNAVIQGCLLTKKPRVAEKIKELIIPAKERIRETILRIAFLSADRMSYDIADFFRPCERVVKIRGKERKINSYEAIPLNEISEKNRMCVDGVDIKTINGGDEYWYKLADRDKAVETFFKCLEIITGKKKSRLICGGDIFNAGNEDTDCNIIREDVKITPVKEAIPIWRKAAEFLRGDDSRL